MGSPPPAVYNIPAGASFVDALAQGLLARWSGDPLALSRAQVLLPTRRACRSLRDAFLRAGGGQPLLLPCMMPLGDLDADELLLSGEPDALGVGFGDDLPPAMPPLRRQLLLTRLILEWSRARGSGDSGLAAAPREDQAARLAEELARLIDQVETEGLTFDRLADLVPEDYADHWQVTLAFLKIVTEHWPALQAAEGCIGPAERRRLLLEAQAEAWRRAPPADPVIVAGSTGSIPATAALIGVVAGLPNGAVVLPGLAQDHDEASWTAIRDDPNHPQYGLARLLKGLGLAPSDVAPWPGAATGPAIVARRRFIDRALAPAEATADWSEPDAAAPGPADVQDLGSSLAAVQRIDCDSPGEEAAVIALILRQSVDVPGRRAALVTPDRALARRVAAELRRWDIEIDDSAGMPLADTPVGTFLRLTASLAASDLAPLPLLSALKHPLAAGGLGPAAFRWRVRALELAVLRGPRPAPGFAGLRRALRTVGETLAPGLREWLDDLEERLTPFLRALGSATSRLGDVVQSHVACAEALAASDEESGAARLWVQEAGEAAALFVAELAEATGAGGLELPHMTGERYPALLDSLMAARVVRPRYGSHPRLAILGPLEARLQQLDVMVLGGLNEGTWPAETEAGPWLSRPMRADFGLPSPERRVGLAAHDFAQAFTAPAVYLTRASRVEGAPTVPSRWLLRVDGLLRALDTEIGLTGESGAWRAWAAALDRPPSVDPIAPPAPRPPVTDRPRELSVTQIETWMRDPYALYAAVILDLQALDPIDADPGAAERGVLVHRALERFIRAHPETLPEDARDSLIAIGRRVFDELAARPGVWAFWWPRFERIADWVVAAERARRTRMRQARPEVRGRLELPGPAGPFRIRAKADRIDVTADGGIAILDYKTGALPTSTAIELGFSPQLPLEAAIAAAGGFAGLPEGTPVELGFWRLSGGEPPGEQRLLRGDPAAWAAHALDGLTALIAAFDDEAMPYSAAPRPDWAPRYSDYAHLARVAEWAGSAPEEAG